MDTKISSDFWDDPEAIELDDKAKLAALWLLTNSRVKLNGYAEISEKVFAFQTGLAADDLQRAYEGLPKAFVRNGKGYWIRNYIKRQIGHGESLVRNNYLTPLLRDMKASPEWVLSAVFEQYPELKEPYEVKALAKGLESHAQAPEKIEKSREEQSRAEQKVGTGAGVTRRRGARAGAVYPGEQADLQRERMIAVAALKRREPSTGWSAKEVEAFRANRLHDMADEAFEAQLAPLRAYYGAVIPREKDFRRQDLATLLNNWAGELDRAKAWVRDNDDGVKRY